MTTSFGYVRGSTDDQQNTLVAQENQERDYCAYKGIIFHKATIDEGESAFSVNFYERPKVQEMLKEMKEVGATDIIITKLDRGFRDALDCLFTVDDLTKRGINLHILDIGLDPATPVGKLLLTMMAGIAEFENKRRSERQKAAFAVMKSSGQRCGAVPYGWDTVQCSRASKTGRQADDLVPNDFEQGVLRFIITSATGGVSDNQIARKLNETNVPTKNAGKTMTRKGRTFTCEGTWSGAQVRSVRLNARLAQERRAA